MACPIIELTQQLIRRSSISPDDAGCQILLSSRLQALGFTIESLRFGDTDNLWAWRGMQTDPTLVFAGHTDVVPPGNEASWHHPPFDAILEGDTLYGRGAADMKGALAAMIVAAERFVAEHPQHKGRMAFLITSDEESNAINGTIKVVETLMARQERVDYCLVGEPSSENRLGDVIKNGRRGSLTANLYIQGVQGHVAYPQKANNPIHRALPALLTLQKHVWDGGDHFFSPTSMQITNLTAGTGSNNVIPGELYVQFNFRFSAAITVEQIQQQVATILNQYSLNYHIDWHLSGLPFLTAKGKLLDVVVNAVQQHTGITPQLLTSGGTSDGRFISQMGAQVVELGPINASIHKVNECVNTADLQQLGHIYQRIMEQILL